MLFNYDKSDYGKVVDVFIIGEINEFSVKDSQDEKKNNDKNDKNEKRYYNRDVALEFSYRYIRASDGAILGIFNKSGTRSDKQENKFSLKDANDMAAEIVRSQLTSIYREIMPWTTTESRPLEADKKDSEQMKEAKKLVKDGNYRAAQKLYNEIYKQTGSFAAGYNEAILTEALDGLPQAISLMKALSAKMSSNGNLKYDLKMDNKIKKELARMQNDYNQQKQARQSGKVRYYLYSFIFA
jgi:hypothetical protein